MLKTHKHTLYFNDQQKQALDTLKQYNVKVNAFIETAIREKIKRDWPQIKEAKNRAYCPF